MQKKQYLCTEFVNRKLSDCKIPQGVDRFWQRAEAVCKHAVRGRGGTIIPGGKPLTGENNYALAAWSNHSRSALFRYKVLERDITRMLLFRSISA